MINKINGKNKFSTWQERSFFNSSDILKQTLTYLIVCKNNKLWPLRSK